MTTFDTKEY